MINPHSSPWLIPPKPRFIADTQLYWRWQAIAKYLSTPQTYKEVSGQLIVNNQFLIAKKSAKMRLISHLDWCHYTPKTLAAAIESNTVDIYYEQQLKDSRSDPNEWRDKPKEMTLKTHYAVRKGRASKI